MKRVALNFLLILALLMASVSVAGASPVAQEGTENPAHITAPVKSPNDVYIVQLSEKPVVAYEGDIQGYKATKPKNNQKINVNHPDVVKYAGYLDSRHNAVLGAVGGCKIYDFRYTYNGFAAVLTEAQAAAIQQVAGVVAVTPDQLLTVDTSSTPAFLGLDAPGGLWSQLGGVGSAGEDIVIGVVDSGIWPESLSFSDRDSGGKLVYHQLPGWNAKCTPGEQFNASH